MGENDREKLNKISKEAKEIAGFSSPI